MSSASVMELPVEHIAACRRTYREGATMSPERGWLNRGETIEVIEARLTPYKEDVAGWRAEVRERLNRQDSLGERLIDGAQAAIYTKHLLPQFLERLESLEKRQIATEDKVQENHGDNTARLRLLEDGQLALRANQHVMRRRLKAIYDFVLRGDDGRMSYSKAAALVGGAAALASSLTTHGTNWWMGIKKFIAIVGGTK